MNTLDEEGDNILLEDNFYQLLNIAKTASNEEIQSAYRRFSRMFHPDKHGTDPMRQKWAEKIFNKIKEAYEVLSDPHRRAIYDNLGKRGLEIEGWEVIFRSRTPREIREEYERLKKEREERRLQQSINPRVNINMSVNATDLFTRYYDDEYEIDESVVIPTIEVSGMSITQSIDVPTTLKDVVTVSSNISTQNGIGSGSVTLSNRRITSEKGWADMEFSVGNGPTLGFKAFRAMSRVVFLSGGSVFHFTPRGAAVSFVSTMAMQLDAHSVGYLTYRASGQGSSMTTTYVRDTERYHSNVAIQLGVPHSLISISYMWKLPAYELKLKTSLKFGSFGGVAEYAAEKKVSQHTSVAAAVAIGYPSGVVLRIKWSRASHSIVVPIHLCEEIMPAPVFYATVVPVVSWLAIKKLILDPINQDKLDRERERSREANRERIIEMQKTARTTVELMKETYSRIRSFEEKKNGLVIIRAVYGKLPPNAKQHVMPEEESGDGVGPDHSDSAYGVLETIDVTIPLQCLIKDSRLELLPPTKSQLAGFYDPCMGEEKHLTIKYSYHKNIYTCTIKDEESVILPRQGMSPGRSK